MKKAFLITFISKYSNILIQFVLTMILARLLTPSDFGIVAVVSIFVSFFGLIGDMGIGPAIIQYKKMTVREISYIFKFTLLVAAFLSVLFYFSSFAIEWFYQENIYRSVCQWFSIAIFFMIASIVPVNLLYRDKRFLSVGVASIISNIFGGAIAVYCAFKGFGVQSLIVNIIVQSIANLFLTLLICKIKLFIPGFNWEPIRKISNFSFYQFLFNFVNYFTRNFDNLIVGKLLGAKELGYYDRAYRTMLYPLQGLTFVVNPVLQPIFSDYIKNKDKIYHEYLKVLQMLSLVGAVIVPICFFNAKEIIIILFGNQWSESIIPFKWLSLSIGIQLVLSTIGSIFQATENTRYMFRTGLISSITFIILSLIGIMIGRSIIWLAIFLTFGFVVNFIQNYYVLITKVLEKPFFPFLFEFKTPVVISLLLFIQNLVLPIPISLSDNYVSLLIRSTITILFYLLLCFLLGQWKIIKKIIRL